MQAKKPAVVDYVVEESGLNVTKITDESANSVIGATASPRFNILFFGKSAMAGSKKNLMWNLNRTLSISPDGSELAYLTRKNKQDNVMVRRATGGGASTQRTNRDINDFCWGPDGNLYLSDFIERGHAKIATIDAHKGSLMRQLTSNNYDLNPSTIDGKTIFFTRIENNGPMIWSYNIETGELVSCTRGYQPTPINETTVLCVRNSSEGNSEIWSVDYINGQETLILSSKDQGFSNPTLSPNGEWILLQGNSKSTSTKKQNLDLFVVKPDGTQLTQLTYHPAMDFCPVWSADGKSIYFISSRGTKDEAYNIWRMNFTL
ncbi:MAG: hypothetical protein K2M19_09085 [Muribaculaceae bacterium]|nr:hypothetical protein [Muribaculaceae bacterium]